MREPGAHGAQRPGTASRFLILFGLREESGPEWLQAALLQGIAL